MGEDEIDELNTEMSQESNDVFEASFREGDAMIKMSVDKKDEEEYSMSEESDNEIKIPSMHNSKSKAKAAKICKLVDDCEEQEAGDKNLREKLDRQRRIRQIDLEMKKKLMELQSLMKGKGLNESAELAREMLGELITNENVNANAINTLSKETSDPNQSNSEVTVNENAVKTCKQVNRLSSSSEEDIDSSSEFIDMNKIMLSLVGKSSQPKQGTSKESEEKPQPTTSKPLMMEERKEKLIKDAELAKGKNFTMTGRQQFNIDNVRNMIHSVLVDEEYCTVRSHLDEALIGKIKRGEYVNFAKLLPRDKIAMEEDNRIQPIFKDGRVMWQTSDQMHVGNVSSFHRWEQAFRVYSKVLVRKLKRNHSLLRLNP